MKNKKLLILLVTVVVAVFALCLAGCGPQAVNESADSASSDSNTGQSDSKDSAEETAVDFTWSADSDCAMCHASEVDSQSNAKCLASIHASSDCATCHSDDAALATAHEGATSAKAAKAALKKTEVPEETCLTCHDKAEIAAKTAGVTTLTDANGTTVNPHELPAVAEHDSIDCNSCHQMHVEDADLSKKATRTCQSCHHADVYECNTCHN